MHLIYKITKNFIFTGLLESVTFEDFKRFLVNLFEKDILELKQQSKKVNMILY